MKTKILIIDNYDSFTWNLVHLVRELNVEVDVYRNDAISISDAAHYHKILLSPGPGIPSESGILLPFIQKYGATHSMLGICLGHQAIAEAYGAKLINLPQVSHGICSEIRLLKQDEPLFKGLWPGIRAGRYHSWAVSKEKLPESLEVIATETESGQIMAIRHREYDLCGVQFHPESILTPQGKTLIENWLKN
ncbi:aminodeoxychorismate/anthranilate synthase component II [Parabacteroides sp. OttesenSCG-928-G21]|nr:aminodeoxychorismate/anthranilate synthase component II [Parabacteroides sp. OttesenSCG-928-G21]